MIFWQAVTYCPPVHTIYYKDKENKEISICVVYLIDVAAEIMELPAGADAE